MKENQIDEIREKHYKLANQALDMALDLDSGFDRDEFVTKLEASKHGMTIVNNFEMMKRISDATQIRMVNLFVENPEQRFDEIKKIMPELKIEMKKSENN